jgi:hypothetical protein
MSTGTDLLTAAEMVTRLARDYEGFAAAAKALTGIGSLENHQAELLIQRDARLAELERIKAATEQSLKDGQALKDQLADELIAFHDARNAEWADAKAKAAELIANATSTADAMRAEASRVIAGKYAELEKEQSNATDQLQSLHAAIDQAKADLAATTDALTEAQLQRHKLLDYLDVMRSTQVL